MTVNPIRDWIREKDLWNVQVHELIFKRITGAGLVIMISVVDLSVLSGVSVLIHWTKYLRSMVS